jgi:hypothetical protein
MSPSPANPLPTERLYQLFETKLHLLQEMQQMAITQADLVAEHDMTALMSLLSRKQLLMESLQSLQPQFAVFQNDDPDARVWSSPARRAECQQMAKLCDGLIQQLIIQENRSLDGMNLKRDMVLSQLEQNAAASQVQQAYASMENSELEYNSEFVIEG